MKGDEQKCKTVFNFLSYFMQVSILSITIPPGTRLEGSKNPPPGTIIVHKTLPSRQKRESKSPPLGHKV